MTVVKVEKLDNDESMLTVFNEIVLHPKKFVKGFGGESKHAVMRSSGSGILAVVPEGGDMPYVIAMRDDYLLHLDRDRYALVGWEHAEQVARGDYSFDAYGVFN